MFWISLNRNWYVLSPPLSLIHRNPADSRRQQRARTALRKELAVRQAERIQREREEELKRKAAAAPPIPVSAPTAAMNHKDKSGAVKPVDEDVIMLDGPFVGDANIASQLFTDQGKPQENIAKNAFGNDKKRAMPDAISIPGGGNADTDPSQISANAIDDLFESKTPTTANKDFDLDSIFNDITVGAGGGMDDSGDLDFNFSAETTDGPGNGSSMLPGLDNYANIGNDMNNGGSVDAGDFQFDLPGQDNAAATGTANAATTSQPSGTDQQQPSGTGDAGLDDLLFDFDYNGEGAGLDTEGTQFDDAFWGS